MEGERQREADRGWEIMGGRQRGEMEQRKFREGDVEREMEGRKETQGGRHR